MENYAPPAMDDEKGWIEIINILRAYADDQISIYTWFRGENSLPQGYTAEDFTQEAIFRFLENPGTYNASKGKFLSFLKYYILRRLVSNLSVLAENELTVDVYQNNLNEDEDDDVNYEDYLPGTISDIVGEIDYNSYVDLIIEKINGETILEKIFEGIFINNLKRRQVCEQYEIAGQDFDNGIRRLNTIIKSLKFLIK